MEQSSTQKENKIEVNIKTYHIICSMSRDFNFEDLGISGFHIEQSQKVTIL